MNEPLFTLRHQGAESRRFLVDPVAASKGDPRTSSYGVVDLAAAEARLARR
jgi:hypothetical protein